MPNADLPPLREVIALHGLAARKALGQHFLLDGNLTAKIVRLAGDLSGVHVLEIGPGPGGLTRSLLDSAAAEVVAVEKDARCLDALAELSGVAPGRLRLVPGDALEIDGVALAQAPRMVIANLPYNVATPLLIGWLRRAWDWRRLVLMFQKEVADRLVAPPGNAAYGRLSVMTQWRCAARIGLGLPASAFTPPPKVASSVVVLDPYPEDRRAPDFAAMERVMAAGFGQRRKMLRQALRGLGDAEALCAAAGIDAMARAERIPVAGWVALAKAFRATAPAAAR